MRTRAAGVARHEPSIAGCVWELQTINEIAEGISRSLELDDVLTGALQRLVRRSTRWAARSACAMS